MPPCTPSRPIIVAGRTPIVKQVALCSPVKTAAFDTKGCVGTPGVSDAHACEIRGWTSGVGGATRAADWD
eukprot:3844249-Alexandrium_andersonii.AAC.1